MIRTTGWIVALIAGAASAQLAPTAYEVARSAPLAPGVWQYRALPGASEAQFGTRVQLRCDYATRRVLVRRFDASVAVAPPPLAISTDTISRPVARDGWLLSSDPLLAAIAFSRGRFVIDGGGSERIVLPSSPEAARTIEDCRN